MNQHFSVNARSKAVRAVPLLSDSLIAIHDSCLFGITDRLRYGWNAFLQGLFSPGFLRIVSKRPVATERLLLVSMLLFFTSCGSQPVDVVKKLSSTKRKVVASRQLSICELGNYDERTFFSSPKQVELAVAISNNDLDSIREIVASGADVNTRSKLGMTPLVWAFFNDNLAAFQVLISLGADPDSKLARDYDEFYRIPSAVICGGDTVMRIALRHEKAGFFLASFPFSDNPDDYSQFGTLLHSFAGPPNRNPLSVLEVMIDAGIDINAKDPSGNTACYLALKNGQIEAVSAMIMAGADVDLGNGLDQETIRDGIRNSIAFKKIAIPQLELTLSGQDADAAEKQVLDSYIDKLEALVELDEYLSRHVKMPAVGSRRSIGSTDSTARSIHFLSEQDPLARKSAMSLSATKSDDDWLARTPMKSAVGQWPASISAASRRLEESSEDVKTRRPFYGKGSSKVSTRPSVLDLEHWNASEFFSDPASRNLADAISRNDLDAVKEIMAAGTSANVLGRAGMSLLFWAYLADDFESFCWLLDQGANPDQRLSHVFAPESTDVLWKGQTVLGASIAEQRYDYCLAALPRSKDVNQRFDVGFNKELTLLHVAVWMPGPSDVSKVISALVDSGIDINAQTDQGWTAAYVAYEREIPLTTLQLIRLGADPDINVGSEVTLRDAVNKEVRQRIHDDTALRPRYFHDLLKVHAFLKKESR